MSAQEIVIDGGLGSKLRFKQRDDMLVVEAINGFDKLTAVLNRGEQHLLFLFLRERLEGK